MKWIIWKRKKTKQNNTWFRLTFTVGIWVHKKLQGSYMGTQGLGSADLQNEWNGMGLENSINNKYERILMTMTRGEQPLQNPVYACILLDKTWLVVCGWGLFARTCSVRLSIWARFLIQITCHNQLKASECGVTDCIINVNQTNRSRKHFYSLKGIVLRKRNQNCTCW